jgi:chromosome segregation ATPase
MSLAESELGIRNNQLSRIRAVLASRGGSENIHIDDSKFSFSPILTSCNALLPRECPQISNASELPNVISFLVSCIESEQRKTALAKKKISELETRGVMVDPDIASLRDERDTLAVELSKATTQIKSLGGSAGSFFIGDTPSPKRGGLRRPPGDVTPDDASPSVVAQLSSEIAQVRSELEAKNREIESLQLSLTSAQAATTQLKRNMDTIRGLQTEVNKMANRSVAEEGEIFRLKASKRADTELGDMLRSELHQTRAELALALASVERVKSELDSARSSLSTELAMVRNLSEKVRANDVRFSELNTVYQTVVMQRDTAVESLATATRRSEDLSARVGSLETTIEELGSARVRQEQLSKESITILSAKLNDCQNQLQEELRRLKSCQADLTQATLQTRVQSETISETQSELNELRYAKTHLIAVEVQLESLQHELDLALMNLATKDAQLSATNMNLQRKDAEIAGLKSDIETLQKKIQEAEIIRELETRKFELQLAGIESSLAELESSKETKISELNSVIAQLRNEVASEANDIVDQSATIADLTRQLEQVTGEYQELQKSIPVLKMELVETQNEKNRLVKDHHDMKSKIDSLTASLSTALSTIENLQHELKLAVEDKNEAEEKVSQLRIEHESYQTEISEKMIHVHQLNAHLATAESTEKAVSEKLRLDVASLEMKLEELQRDCDASRADTIAHHSSQDVIDNLQHELATTVAVKETLERTVTELKEEHKKYQTEMAERMMSVHQLNSQREKCGSELEAVIKSKSDLITELEAKVVLLEEDLAIAKFERVDEDLMDRTQEVVSPSPDTPLMPSPTAGIVLEIEAMREIIAALEERVSGANIAIEPSAPQINAAPSRKHLMVDEQIEFMRVEIENLREEYSLLEDELVHEKLHTSQLSEVLDAEVSKRRMIEATARELAEKSTRLWDQYQQVKKSLQL